MKYMGADSSSSAYFLVGHDNVDVCRDVQNKVRDVFKDYDEFLLHVDCRSHVFDELRELFTPSYASFLRLHRAFHALRAFHVFIKNYELLLSGFQWLQVK